MKKVLVVTLLIIAVITVFSVFTTLRKPLSTNRVTIRLPFEVEYVFPRAFVYLDSENPIKPNETILFGNGTLKIRVIKILNGQFIVNYTLALTLCSVEYFPSCFLEGVPEVIYFTNTSTITVDYATGLARNSKGEVLGKFNFFLSKSVLEKTEAISENNVIPNCTKIAINSFHGKSIEVSCGKFRKFPQKLLENIPSNIRVNEIIILSYGGEVPLETTKHRLIINYVYDSKTTVLLTAKINYIDDILYKLYRIRFLDFLGSKKGLYLKEIVYEKNIKE